MAALHMSDNSPMTWEIVYIVMCGLTDNIYLYILVVMTVVGMAVDDMCILMFT